MFSKKKSEPVPDPPGGGAMLKSNQPVDQVKVREVGGGDKPLRRPFPGPRDPQTVLRVAAERGAYAELIAHAKESLQAEVCGVLAGHVCEDDEGPWLHVEAIIRGTAASQGNTHVTFTQATWNAIHQTLEKDFPRLKIVGWYHTHPGFGVEFSDMDLFIQKNFFGGPTQIALVTDPLSGAVAIAANTPGGIEYLQRYWVDGREQQCRTPERHDRKTDASASPGGTSQAAGEAAESVRTLEARIGQLIQAHDELRQFHYRFLMICGALFCIALMLVVGYTIFSQMTSRVEPPKVNQVVPVPIQVGDKVVLVGVGITEWQVPPELNAILLEAELLKQQAAEKAAKEAAKKAGKTKSSGSATNAAPSAPKPPPAP